ncbi:hypothetical protein [Terrabacter sp. MAHUQ-38]|uniref:hypothetical protein n=1 Tax=unclassified Terrabacter TaxID=2630222 RepID=UPI00165D32CF|nr:hypothetical protein [Terrabacter sp. MAHUQ-38]MBC9823963.1 hypothetical protein [Terrabacter sp. MAHUQ-38]
MTTSDQQEHELQNLLRQQADRVDVPGDFAPVAIAARRRSRRNRAVLGSAAAVAVIAVGVPAVWSSRSGPSPVPALTTSTTSVLSPSSSVPTTPATTPPTTPAGTDSPDPSATNPPPTGAVATRENTYALDDTIRVADTALQLEKGTVVENLTVLANGGFVLQSHMSTGPSNSEMELLSPAGRRVTNLGLSGTYAVSPDGTRVLAKSGAADTLVVYAPDGSVVGQRTDAREVAAIVGDVAYLNGDASRGSLEWNVVTGATKELPAHVVAVSRDRTQAALQWFVATDAMDEICWAVVDLTSPSFPKTVEKCGPDENPTMFMPGAFSSRGTYLVGSHYIDGGDWFIPGVVRVSDGTVELGWTNDRAPILSGWTWHLDDDESTLLVSRNTSDPPSPARRNTLQRCTLSMDCTDVRPTVNLADKGGSTQPRYVVPR